MAEGNREFARLALHVLEVASRVYADADARFIGGVTDDYRRGRRDAALLIHEEVERYLEARLPKKKAPRAIPRRLRLVVKE